MSFPTSVRTAWVVKSVASGATDTSKLLPFQVGIFDYDSRKPVAGFTTNPFIFLACGSPNTKEQNQIHPKMKDLNNRNVDVSFKTTKIFGKELLPARVSKPAKIASPYVTYIGYNGIDDCKTLKFEGGKTYGIRVYLEGSGGVGLTFPQGMNDIIYFNTPKIETCGVDCTTSNYAERVLSEIVTKFNKSWVAPYIQCDKLVSCCPAASAITKTLFKEWSLTVCDEGNALALAKVQNQYPTLKVTRISRIGTTSVYQVIQPSATASPAAFVQSELIIPDCPTCPAGYTASTAGVVAIVTIDNGGLGVNAAAWLAEVQAIATLSTAIEAVRVGFANGTSTYVVTMPANFTQPAVTADVTVYLTGEKVSVKCTKTSPTSITWVEGIVKYKIKRTLSIQLSNPDCNGGVELPSIITHLSADPSYVSGSAALTEAGTCISTYTADQFNNAYLLDDCDTAPVPMFDPLPAYKGQVWGVVPCEGWTVDGNGCPVPPAPAADADCRSGLKFTGAFIDMNTGGCFFDVTDAVNYDPIRFSVSVVEFTGTDQIGGMLPVEVDTFVAKLPKTVFLSGQEVARDVLLYRNYRDNELYFSPQMELGYKFLANKAQELGVDLNKFYYAVNIQHSRHGRISTDIRGIGERQEITLYFEEGDFGVMQQFLAEYNRYCSSTGVNLPVVI